MFRLTTTAVALSSILASGLAQAVTLYEQNDDYVALYGEVGVGGHIATNSDYIDDEFFDDKAYVDDSFATIGVKGRRADFTYRIELDYERANWLGGDGEFQLAIDKMYIGYLITENHWVEFGLTDTAFDDYDHFGDFTFNKSVETGEAGDQENTVKYQGKFQDVIFDADFILGVSYSYEGEHESGALQGDIVNGYLGYMSDFFSVVVGLEARGGSNGISKYGEQQQVGVGARLQVLPKLMLGFNGFVEDEDLATRQSGDVYLDYQTFRNYGATFSAKYALLDNIDIIGSANYEEYEGWDVESPNYDYTELPPEFGAERTWGSLGVNYWPAKDLVLSIEGRVGEAPEAAYAYARIYF